MDLQEITKERWVDFAVSLMIGVWGLLALTFPLMQMNITNLLTYKECGFELIDFNSIFLPDDNNILGVFMSIFMLVHLALSIALIVLAILSLFDKSCIGASKSLVYYCYALIFLYMILGILFSELYKDSEHWLDMENGNLGSIDESTTSIFTLSYIPFIITSLILFAYWLYGALTYGKNKKMASVTEDSTSSEIISNTNFKKAEDVNDIVKQLTSYKELLDNGTITQEEFEKLKKKLIDE